MLDRVDKTFHQMPFPIPPAIRSRLFGTLMWWDYRFCAARNYQINHSLPGVPAIGNHALKRQSFQPGRRLWAVVALPSGQAEPQWVPQPIANDMDFGAETA